MSRIWEQRIRRAERLAADHEPMGPVLGFYAELLRHQSALYDLFERERPAGTVEADVPLIARHASPLLQAVAARGPDQLAGEASRLLEGGLPACEQVLTAYWEARSDRSFFAKALFQAYGQWLADAGVRRIGGVSAGAAHRCPRCGGAPQASVLGSTGAGSSDGASRELLCATCLTAWPFQRVSCAFCGEQDERKLGYFQSPLLDHIRLDACEHCRRYIKTIDLGRLGLAVPLVDEVAGAHLDVWAGDHGYQKIELNLVGL